MFSEASPPHVYLGNLGMCVLRLLRVRLNEGLQPCLACRNGVWDSGWPVMESLLKQRVAIIEYITHNDIEEGTALHSAQWTLLEQLFCISGPFIIATKDVRAERHLLNKVILFSFLPKGNGGKTRGNPSTCKPQRLTSSTI